MRTLLRTFHHHDLVLCLARSMGAYCSRAKPYTIYSSKQGLDGAGKTTILYQLKLGEVVCAATTTGFNLEEMSVGRTEINILDVGIHDDFSFDHHHFYPISDALVYIIDSHHQERLDEALDQLDQLVLNEVATREKVLMILANKQDLEGALPPVKIENIVREKIASHGPTLGERIVFVKGCSATKNEGLNEAFTLFGNIIKQQKTGKVTPGFKTIQSLEETIDRDGFLDKMFSLPYVKSLLFN